MSALLEGIVSFLRPWMIDAGAFAMDDGGVVPRPEAVMAFSRQYKARTARGALPTRLHCAVVRWSLEAWHLVQIPGVG